MSSDPPKSRLAARGLVVSRAGRRLLDGADFTIEAGAIAVIEGSSGSGKTTLLRALATLIAADSGSIALDDREAAEIAPTVYRRRVAYVPQQPPMLEGTVAGNVAVGPKLAGRAPAPAAITKLLDRVGLPAELFERAARDLSGGERQRVALARALANEPSFLLLDEPTSALDPAAAARVLDLVKELAGQGLGVVVVTHAEEHARSLGGARYVFAEGRVTPRAAA